MKRIRKIITVITIGATVFLTSCEKDDNSPGSSSDDRDKYIGAWTCNETSTQYGPSTYTITISKDVTSANKIKAQNFYHLGSTAYIFIIVDGNNMTINQEVISPDTLNGSGTYNSNNTLSFSFTNHDGQTVDNVTVAAHK